MSLYRSMSCGSWIVKRRILGVHLRRATGIEDLERARELEQVLLKLGKHGLRDLVVAFHRGEVSGGELLASVERFGLTYQLTTERMVPLRRAVYEWLKRAELAEKTRKEYRYNFIRLVGKLPPLDREPTRVEERFLARGPDRTELPELLRRYARRAKPMMFVQVKAAAQSYVRRTVAKGQQSEMWKDLAGIQGPKRRARDVGLGLSPERAREVAVACSGHGPVYGQMWWTMCCTGMHWKEYAIDGWKALADRIDVYGEKRAFRMRSVPLLTTPVRPACGERKFRRVLKAVGEKLGIEKLTSYVARRTFAHFLELTKIPDSQCDILMGHSPKTDREKYREHDIVPYLPAIGAAMRKVIGQDPVYMKAMA